MATSITTSSADLNGAGVPNSEQTTGWFRISSTNPGTCDDTFGNRVPASGGTDLFVVSLFDLFSPLVIETIDVPVAALDVTDLGASSVAIDRTTASLSAMAAVRGSNSQN